MHASCSSLVLLFFFVPAAVGQQAELRRAAVGVTQRETEIVVHLAADAEILDSSGCRVLLIGGRDGELESAQLVETLRQKVLDAEPAARRKSCLSFIPNVYPDGVVSERNRLEERQLSQWISMYGPDVVIEVRVGKSAGYWLAKNAPTLAWLDSLLARDWPKLPLPDDDFARQLSAGGDVGVIPTIVLQLPVAAEGKELKNFELLLQLAQTIDRSSARAELIRRREMPREEVIRRLTKSYRIEFQAMTKLDTVRARLLLNAPSVIGMYYDGWIDDMQKWDKQGYRPEPPSWLFLDRSAEPVEAGDFERNFPGILAQEQSARAWHPMRDRIIDAESEAATDVVDALFTIPPILAEAGRLSGQPKFTDAAVAHYRQLKKLCQRDDGLFRHSPLCDAAWGRGNGYALVGLVRTLEELSQDHPAREELKADLDKLCAALYKHQDVFGCWHQLIDKPGSYPEFTATCLIAWGLKRSLRSEWHNFHERKALDRAWSAVQQRIGPDGKIADVCPSLGKQKTIRDYYDRAAINDADARAGALAMILAMEMMHKR